MTRSSTSSARRAAPAPNATAKAAKAKVAKAANAAKGGRRIQVKRSGVHGKGVFAVQPIAAGETVIEYVGEVISWEEAQRRHPHDLCDPNHTFYFHIDGDHVIDALFDGNASKWINHACDPNCESDERAGRIFIQAVRDIAAGEELNYDYGLVLDERYTAKLKAEYACHCGAAHCRGTMLAPKRGVKLAARPAQVVADQQADAQGKAEGKGKAKTKTASKPKGQAPGNGQASPLRANAGQTAQAAGKASAGSDSQPAQGVKARKRAPGKPLAETARATKGKRGAKAAKGANGAKAVQAVQPTTTRTAPTAPKAPQTKSAKSTSRAKHV